MLCPVCKVELKMADRQGVEIDYCPQCRGVWLDRGELDKIIERSAGLETPDRAYQDGPDPGRLPDTRHEDDDYRRRGRKRGFWSEIFDFD